MSVLTLLKETTTQLFNSSVAQPVVFDFFGMSPVMCFDPVFSLSLWFLDTFSRLIYFGYLPGRPCLFSAVLGILGEVIAGVVLSPNWWTLQTNSSAMSTLQTYRELFCER